MIQPTKCPVCQSQAGFPCTVQQYGNRDADLFNCDVCGRFPVSRTALVDMFRRDRFKMSQMQRAALSHRIRSQIDAGREPEMLTTDFVNQFMKSNPRLPTPAQQATNIIRFVGGQVDHTGMAIELMPPSFPASIGAPNRNFAFSMLFELIQKGLLKGLEVPDTNNPNLFQEVSLTLAGWGAYEEEQRGRVSGSYGFIALKFGDPILDQLLTERIKPALEALGYELVDMRDVARAGVIDNLLRVQIRDAAFVLVDLTHENAGAYWEAGYAEGLGKPVLYICEKSKFEEKQTHFDTNHCTTVLWEASQIDRFLETLIATLKRSLNI